MSTQKMTKRVYSKNNETWTSELEFTRPINCPHCSFANSPTLNSNQVLQYDKGYLQVFSWKCTHCSESYVTGHTRKDTADKFSEFLFIFPSLKNKQFSSLLEDLSPRFIQIYNEASTSEQAGHITLAGIGYRLSLEILVKDFAIIELEKDEDEVSKKTLFNAISEYLPNTDHIVSADVVRIKGNDYAHYKEKYTDLEFEDMKFYLDTLIDLINVQLRLKHPPVSR